MSGWAKEFDEKFPVCTSESIKKFIRTLLAKAIEEHCQEKNCALELDKDLIIKITKSQCADELVKTRDELDDEEYADCAELVSKIDNLIKKWRR